MSPAGGAQPAHRAVIDACVYEHGGADERMAMPGGLAGRPAGSSGLALLAASCSVRAIRGTIETMALLRTTPSAGSRCTYACTCAKSRPSSAVVQAQAGPRIFVVAFPIRARTAPALGPACRLVPLPLLYLRHTVSATAYTSAVLALRLLQARHSTMGFPSADEQSSFFHEYAWILGFAINLVCTFLAALGLNLQQRALTRQTEHSRKIWLLGLGLITTGSILDLVALSLASISLLAPLASLTLIHNMWIAPRMHSNTTLTLADKLATIVIALGVAVSSAGASKETPTYTSQELRELWIQPHMVTYGAFAGLTAVALWYGQTTKCSRRMSAHRSSHLPISRGAGLDAPYSPAREKLWLGLLHVVCTGGLAGFCGGHSVLFAKTVMEELKATALGMENCFKVPMFYGLLAATVVSLAVQLRTLNAGLARFDSLIIVPVYQSAWIIASIIAGLVYFQEFKGLSGAERFLFLCGVLLTISGIAYLLRQRMHTLPRIEEAELAHGEGAPSDVGTAVQRSTGLYDMSPQRKSRRTTRTSTELDLVHELAAMLGDDDDDDQDEDTEFGLQTEIELYGLPHIAQGQAGAGSSAPAEQQLGGSKPVRYGRLAGAFPARPPRQAARPPRSAPQGMAMMSDGAAGLHDEHRASEHDRLL